MPKSSKDFQPAKLQDVSQAGSAAALGFSLRGWAASGRRTARRTWAVVVMASVAGAASVVSAPVSAAPLDSMIKAVKFNDVSAVKKLLAHGVDPNSVDDHGAPLIVIAAREKSNDVAVTLMNDKRTDVEKLDAAGENAMMLAAISQDAPLVKAMIAKGAEVNKKGWTPLHYAASVGDDAIVKILIDASAYVDASSPNGTTPLMMAARGGHASTIGLLLAQGADPTVKNQIGMTALDFGKRYNEKDALTALDGKDVAWRAAHPPTATPTGTESGPPLAPAPQTPHTP